MNRCLYRRFIRRSILNQLAAELIRRVLNIGRRIIRRYEVDFNSSNSAPLSFSSILLLQPCFHELSALDRCRMDLPGPTTSVGTRTDYSVGPWDYPACAARHLKAWSTRATQE
jgi:hypothetical protein